MEPPHPPSADPALQDCDLLSVGDVSRETGLTPDTLRVWERRYGFPSPVRLPSGHRRYTREDVRRLRRLAEAVARGHRPGELVSVADAELDRVLAGGGGPAEAPRIADWLALVREWRGAELTAALRAAAAREEPLDLLSDSIGPLVAAVGRAWADGELEVGHEHFASRAVEEVLRELRARLRSPRARARALLATLPDELHTLGLDMAAVAFEHLGVHTAQLGANTPLVDLASAARETGAEIVAISVSLAHGGPGTDAALVELHRALPATTQLLVGGAGATGPRRVPAGVVACPDFASLAAWVERRFPPDPGGGARGGNAP